MKLSGGIWHNEFPLPLVDTGKKKKGWPPYRRRTLWEYTAHPENPLTFQCAESCFVRPDRHFFTDLASIPEVLQIFMPKDIHNPSAVLHDSACLYKSLFFSSTLNGVYVKCYISSSSAAELFGKGLYAAGYKVRAYPAWRAVVRFGPKW